MALSIYFVTFCTWERLELNLAARQVVMEACQYFHGERYAIFAGVVMPDHVHLLIQPWLKGAGKFWTIGSILHSIKGFSSKQIPSVMPHIGKVWQDGRHERLVVGDRQFQTAVNYIYQNPVIANLVQHSEPYPYCWSISPIAPSASVSLASKPKLVQPLTHHYTHPKTIELLRDRAFNDPDEQLREWAQEQLCKMTDGE
jgi:REP element-mobilizing transposase RayT